jgi:hypothetical protein
MGILRLGDRAREFSDEDSTIGRGLYDGDSATAHGETGREGSTMVIQRLGGGLYDGDSATAHGETGREGSTMGIQRLGGGFYDGDSAAGILRLGDGARGFNDGDSTIGRGIL